MKNTTYFTEENSQRGVGQFDELKKKRLTWLTCG